MRTNLPRAVRALRLARGWTQAELGRRSGVSHQMVSRIEHDEIEGVTVQSLDRVLRALGAMLDVRASWRGAELDRLIDARHAGLEDELATFLRMGGWEVRAEVSFNHFGDRGRVDLVAWHPTHGHLLIVEVKTQIGDLQETLGRLDVKTRLAPVIAKELGWRPSCVIPALVLADTPANRRVVAVHSALFSRFAVRGRAAVAWLRHAGDAGPMGLLWYVNRPNSHGVRVTSAKRATKAPNARRA